MIIAILRDLSFCQCLFISYSKKVFRKFGIPALLLSVQDFRQAFSPPKTGFDSNRHVLVNDKKDNHFFLGHFFPRFYSGFGHKIVGN